MKRMWKKGMVVVVFSVIAAACQSGPPKISIEAAEAALSPAIVGEAMVSMKIVNSGGDDMLAGVKTNIPGATASLHVMQGKRMVKVDIIDIPPKRTMDFAMGADHIMIENMPRTMKEGSNFTLTLVFEKSGEKAVPLTLQKASMPMQHAGHEM